MSNRTVPAAAEGMPDDVREFRRICECLSPAARAELRALAERLLAKEATR